MFQLVKALFRRTPRRRTAPTTRLAVEALETRATPAASPAVLHGVPDWRPIAFISPEFRPVAPVGILLPSLKPNERLGILLPSLKWIDPAILPVRHLSPELLK